MPRYSSRKLNPEHKILTLRACSPVVERYFKLPHNRSRSLAPSVSTAYSETDETPTSSFAAGLPKTEERSLVLSFANPPNDIVTGFTMGRSNECDIILGKADHGMSRTHFVFRFDSKQRLIMRDVSKLGSRVSYNGQPLNHRTQWTWMLPAGARLRVEVERSIAFEVEVPDHSNHSDWHRALRSYLTRAAAPSLDSLRMKASNLSTCTDTPRDDTDLPQGPVFVRCEEVGSGGFGHVFKMWNTSTGAICAGKSIREKYLAEISTLRRLKHESIVKFMGVYYFEQEALLLMTYHERGSLEDEYHRRRYGREEVMIFMSQVSSGLAYLHTNKVIHRDVKPGNVLVRSREPMEVCLADLGLAHRSVDSDFGNRRAGTSHYAAPEFYRDIGSKDITYWEACDIWSAGVVALRYTFGIPRDVLECREWSPDIPEFIYDSIEQSLDDDPDDALAGLISEMLQLDPWNRLDAVECASAFRQMILDLRIKSQHTDKQYETFIEARHALAQDAMEIKGRMTERCQITLQEVGRASDPHGTVKYNADWTRNPMHVGSSVAGTGEWESWAKSEHWNKFLEHSATQERYVQDREE